ncbi:MAG: tetratricopeptide repeat protein [Flavobacterium sp.]
MKSKEEILKKAIGLNDEEKWDETDSLLTTKVLAHYNDIELYAEKVTALYRLEKKESAEKIAFSACLLDDNNSKINNYLGHIFSDKRDYIKGEQFYKKAIEKNPKNVEALNGLGNLYENKKEHEKAEECYNKAIEINPEYPSSYNGLGSLYDGKEEYDKAKKFYKKAIEIDPKYTFAYYNLGLTYKKLKEYSKAEECYTKAIEINPNYSSPYNGLGSLHFQKKEYDKAKEFYNKAIEIKPDGPNPYYNLALIFSLRNEYQEAKENYEKYINLKNDEDFYLVHLAKSRLEEIENILENKQYEKINIITSKIKDLLCLKKGHITHYTGISVAKYLILNETPFRLSEGTFLNDTSEGTILFEYLKFEATNQNNCGPHAFAFSKKPFIGSFVNHSKNNDLTLWRMYGKENLEEGKGCAITIDIDELRDSIKQKLKTGNDDIKSTEELEFYKVAYLSNGKFTFSEAKATEITKLNKLMNDLESEVTAYKAKDPKPKETLKIIELLNEVAYLFKNAEYQYENEVRLVIKEAIGFEKNIDLSFTPPKVYIELVPILPIIKGITIGPKVDRADEWASAFHYQLAKKGLKPEINISRLPYK